jgi:hypothetical protein
MSGAESPTTNNSHTLEEGYEFVELVVVIASIELRQDDNVFGLILHVFLEPVDDYDLLEVSVEVLQVLDVAASSPNHALLAEDVADVAMSWIHVVQRVHDEG